MDFASFQSLYQRGSLKRNKVSKCRTCSGQLAGKKSPPKPYGATGTIPYCPYCDRDYVYKVSKSSERRKVKNNIKKQIDEN